MFQPPDERGHLGDSRSETIAPKSVPQGDLAEAGKLSKRRTAETLRPLCDYDKKKQQQNINEGERKRQNYSRSKTLRLPQKIFYIESQNWLRFDIFYWLMKPKSYYPDLIT